MPERREAVRTAVEMRDYTRAMMHAWLVLERVIPSRETVGVLWAQYRIETGGQSCWNWNIGNVKHVDGDGHDWIELRGVWEGVSLTTARELVARGLAVMDHDPGHAKAVGPGRVSVIFQPPHPATRFRAYASLDEAMASHLTFLKRRYARAWVEVERGDPVAFAKRLKEGADGKEDTRDDYYTASSESYARGMRPYFVAFLGTRFYDEEERSLLAKMDADTEKTIVESRPEPFMPIVHPPVPMPPRCFRCGLMSCSGDCPLI